MYRYECMLMKLTDFPMNFQQQYNIQAHAKNGYVYIEIRRSIYNFPQSGKLANKYLQEKLRPHRYYEVSHTPVLWKYAYCPIDFSFVVDNFGVQYVGEDNKHHLIDSLKEDFAISEDWTWGLYYEINLKWDYNNLTLDISMREYIRKIAKVQAYATPQTSICPLPYRLL